MEIKTILLSIFFFILMVVNMVSSRGLLKRVIQSADINMDEANEFFQERSSSRFQQRDTYRWLYHNALDKKRFQHLYRIYALCTLPSPICVILAMANLFVRGIDTEFKIAAVVMTVLVIIIAVMGRSPKNPV